MEETHANRVGEAGKENPIPQESILSFDNAAWKNAFASFSQTRDQITDVLKSLNLPPLELANHWQLDKRLNENVDRLRTPAEISLSPKDLLAQNPQLAENLGKSTDKLDSKVLQDASSGAGIKVRHATTGEIDAGWKFEGLNPDGSVRLSKNYTLDVKAKDKHDKLVETLPGVPPEHSKALEKKLAQLPANVLKALDDKGYKIIACPTNTDAIPELKGKTPRGWSPDSTFDNSDGTHDNVRRLILAPTRFKQGDEFVPVDREEVLVHEIGHAVDHAFGKLSNSAEFQEAFKADMKKLAEKGPFMSEREKLIYDYFNQKNGPGENERPGSEEAFASMFGLVLTAPENPEDQEPFEKNFQNTIKVVRDQISKL